MAESGVGPGDLVFDLGAGTGALTVPLLRAGAQVIAIEKHPARVAQLRDRLHGRAKVVQADLNDLYLPARPFSVVANPPFALTTHLVRTILAAPGLRSADLVLQRGAARGLAARPPARRGSLELRVGRHLPSGAFTVPPSVACAVLQIRPARPTVRTTGSKRAKGTSATPRRRS